MLFSVVPFSMERAVQMEREKDTELVEGALSGDVRAYRELVERYQQRVFAVAMGLMGNADDAEEVVQEAFFKAYRNLKGFRKESSFYTWLYRIVYNLALDEKRRKYRHVESTVGEMLDVNESDNAIMGHVRGPEEEHYRGVLRRQIAAAIEKLSPEHRMVILLREVEGLSYAEMSNVVGCSKGTVMSRLHHARKRLQKMLQPYRLTSDVRDDEKFLGEGRTR